MMRWASVCWVSTVPTRFFISGMPPGSIPTWRLSCPGSRSIQLMAIGVAGLIGCLVCGSLALTEPSTTPGAVRSLLALFASFGLGWTLLATWLLSRGRGNFFQQRTLAAQMAFGFTLAAVVALSLAAFSLGKEEAGTPMLATGLALLILAAVIVIDVRIERAELTIREQILRVETRLVEMHEAQGKSSDPR